MVRILFVCLGNTCRSPMARAVLMHKVRALGLENEIEADSAGTDPRSVGHSASEGTLLLLRRKHIDIHHRSRHINAADLETFDYVIPMDADNLTDVRALGPGRATVRLLLDYAPQMSIAEVPDPYFTGDYLAVFNLIDIAIDGILEAIRRDHNLSGTNREALE